MVIERDRVIKRELGEHKLRRRPNHDVLRPFWARERLGNEAATLAFVAANTTIPVPPCRLYTQDSLLHLETKRITNGVLLEEMDQERRAAAAAAVDHQITSFVLPQLRSLRRGYLGSVDPSLPVFPPRGLGRLYPTAVMKWQPTTAGEKVRGVGGVAGRRTAAAEPGGQPFFTPPPLPEIPQLSTAETWLWRACAGSRRNWLEYGRETKRMRGNGASRVEGGAWVGAKDDDDDSHDEDGVGQLY